MSQTPQIHSHSGPGDGGKLSVGEFKPESATLQSRTDVNTLSGITEFDNPVVDVTDPNFIYGVDSDNEQYVALDVSDPTAPTVSDTVSNTVGLEPQLIAHPDGEHLYHEGPENVITLTSPGSFGSVTTTGLGARDGGAAIGDSLYVLNKNSYVIQYDISTRTSPSFVEEYGIAPDDDSIIAYAAIDDNDILWAYDNNHPAYVGADVSGGGTPVPVAFGTPTQSIQINATPQLAFHEPNNRLYLAFNRFERLVIADITLQ